MANIFRSMLHVMCLGFVLFKCTSVSTPLSSTSDFIQQPRPTQWGVPYQQETVWVQAPTMPQPNISTRLEHVQIRFPVIPGAVDYRAIIVQSTTQVGINEHQEEFIQHADMFCTGYQVGNHTAQPQEPETLLDISGITQPTYIMLEALQDPCPFAGITGQEATLLPLSSNAQTAFHAIIQNETLYNTYGGLIFGGTRTGPTLAQPGAPHAPRVLARRGFWISPTITTPQADFVELFNTEIAIQDLGPTPNNLRSVAGHAYESERFSFYSYGHDYSEFRIVRNQLQTTLADWAQEVFATNLIIPKYRVHLSTNDYTHIHYEVDSNATQRRYWWFALCGSNTLGRTFQRDNTLTSPIIQTPFFYQPDGRNPSLAGFNCLQIFPRDGSPFLLPQQTERPQSDIRIMINQSNCGETQHSCFNDRNNVVNVSSPMYPNNESTPSWYGVLDDRLYTFVPTAFDLYIKKDEVVIYIENQQKICNRFPYTPLTLAEGAAIFGQVLYHSSAEHLELTQSFNDRSAQRYYLKNTPYIDVKSWDTITIQEHAPLPADFDASTCYTYAP